MKHLAKEKEAMKKVVTTSLRHRENIGRIGSLRVFWQLSVIAVFPKKTGDLMFVGFDSQNTSHFFQTIQIGICGFLEFLKFDSEMTQRISRGDNCVICVEICEISRETWVSS